MNDLMWGLSMMVVGMGVVFLLLLLLMAVLMLTSRLDRTRTSAPLAARHSTSRSSVPARRSSTRSWCCNAGDRTSSDTPSTRSRIADPSATPTIASPCSGWP